MKKHLALLLCLSCAASPALAQNSSTPASPNQQPSQPSIPAAQQQQPPQQPQDDQDEVLRVSSTLVQTDLTVFDRSGKFVEGIRPEQLELKVDGKPQTIDFFERITAGSADEARRIAAARGETIAPDATITTRPRPVTFYVDDLNLSPQGVSRARDVIINFIDKQLQPGTQVLIVTSSGQLRFYQQFTDDREILRAAVRRIKYQAMSRTDIDRPVMTDYQAVLIDSNDRDALAYHIYQYVSLNPGAGASADTVVRQRARRIRQQAAQRTQGVIQNLERAVAARSSDNAAGRQLMFFISEGFILDRQERDLTYRLQRAVDAAARSGTVVYTLDARGLASGAPDASDGSLPTLNAPDNLAAGGNAYSGRDTFDDLRASQDVLRTIAEDTGGRALLNNNALEASVQKTLDETANYYLIAWRPTIVDEKTGRPKFRKIEVRIKDRNDLKVRVRRGFFASPETTADRARQNTANQPTTPNGWLNRALNSLQEERDLTLELYPTFAYAESASVVTAYVQLARSRLVFGNAANGKRQSDIDLACVLLDESGKAVGSDGRSLSLAGDAATTAAAVGTAPNASSSNAAVSNQTGANSSTTTTRPQPLGFSFTFRADKPGTYQLRVAARDRASGLMGTRFVWITVPELKASALSLSTLLIADAASLNQPANDQSATTSTATRIKVDRRFDRRARLLMQLYLYNAARGGAQAAQPDVWIEIKVLSGATVALSAPAHRASLENQTDLSRILYTAQIPLAKLTRGSYVLQVIATDRVSKTTQTRETTFSIE